MILSRFYFNNNNENSIIFLILRLLESLFFMIDIILIPLFYFSDSLEKEFVVIVCNSSIIIFLVLINLIINKNTFSFYFYIHNILALFSLIIVCLQSNLFFILLKLFIFSVPISVLTSRLSISFFYINIDNIQLKKKLKYFFHIILLYMICLNVILFLKNYSPIMTYYILDIICLTFIILHFFLEFNIKYDNLFWKLIYPFLYFCFSIINIISSSNNIDDSMINTYAYSLTIFITSIVLILVSIVYFMRYACCTECNFSSTRQEKYTSYIENSAYGSLIYNDPPQQTYETAFSHPYESPRQEYTIGYSAGCNTPHWGYFENGNYTGYSGYN